MERRKVEHEHKPPNVLFVVLASLFGYPGAGHLMVGKKKLGVILAVVFTATTVAIVLEIAYLLPPLFAYMQGEALAVTHMPNWGRMGAWIVLTTAIWLGSAIHAGILAQRLNQAAPVQVGAAISAEPDVAEPNVAEPDVAEPNAAEPD